jgi:uncharacterized protein (DUF433 family)
MPISSDPGVLGSEPRIEGTRIGVRHVVERVIDGDQSPAYVADQLDVSLSDVYNALAYYYEHVDEISDATEQNNHAFDRINEQTLQPKEPIE